MTKLELIYTIAAAAIAALVVIYLIVLAIKNGWVKKLTDTLNESLHYAEKNITGPVNKKQYVMDKLQEKCIELSIPWFLICGFMDKFVEKIVANYNRINHGK